MQGCKYNWCSLTNTEATMVSGEILKPLADLKGMRLRVSILHEEHVLIAVINYWAKKNCLETLILDISDSFEEREHRELVWSIHKRYISKGEGNYSGRHKKLSIWKGYNKWISSMAKIKHKSRTGKMTLTWEIFRTEAAFIVLFCVWHNVNLLQQIFSSPILQIK